MENSDFVHDKKGLSRPVMEIQLSRTGKAKISCLVPGQACLHLESKRFYTTSTMIFFIFFLGVCPEHVEPPYLLHRIICFGNGF